MTTRFTFMTHENTRRYEGNYIAETLVIYLFVVCRNSFIGNRTNEIFVLSDGILASLQFIFSESTRTYVQYPLPYILGKQYPTGSISM